MKIAFRKTCYALVLLATVLIPVRLGLSASESVKLAAAHASMTTDAAPCHGGGGQPVDRNADDCVEHCWKSAIADRVTATAKEFSFSGIDCPCLGEFYATPVSSDARKFDIDYIGRLVLKRHVETVNLRN
jgi:hypothetical protein